MEPKYSIFDSWKFFSLGTFVGFLVFFIYCDFTQQNVSLSIARNGTIQFASPFNYIKLLNISTSSIYSIHPSNLSTNSVKKKCNIFDGKWVYKPEELSPRYDSFNCPFIEEKMSCQNNRRPDNDYEKWIWEASACDIPLFNGKDMLKRLRNKRMILVGDSLNRNMWESLACLLFTSINSTPTSNLNQTNTKYTTTWKAQKYNFTLEFYWSPFLIELNTTHEGGKKVLILDKISSNAEKWKGADIMVFNSGHWWDQRGRFKAWDWFEYDGKLTKDMSIEVAFKRGLKTWAKWIKINVDPNKTRLFFRSISAPHKFIQYDQWCYNKTQPIMDDSYVPVFPRSMVHVIESVIKGMNKSRIKYMNITKLSESRIDAHPSMYRFNDWNMLAEKYGNNLGNYADCTHWCLPGVPDTWNRLLYAFMFFDN